MTVNYAKEDSFDSQDEESSSSSEDGENSSEEESVRFIQSCAATVVSRVPKISSTEIIDSLPESDSWRPSGGNRFENQSAVIIMARTSVEGKDFPILADSGSSPSLIERKRFKELWPDVPILKMSESDKSLRVRAGFNAEKGKAETLPDYGNPSLLLATEDGRLVRVHLEMHITDVKIDAPGIILGGADMNYNNMDVSYTTQSILMRPLRSLETYVIPMAVTSRQKVISDVPMRAVSKVKVPAGFTGFIPVSLKDMSGQGPFILTPKGKVHGKDNQLCSAPFMIVSHDTTYVEYSNFSKDDVFVQSGQVLGKLEDLDGDDTYVQALSHEDRRNGVKLNKMMSKLPSDHLEPDEIEVGLSLKDLNIEKPSTINQTAFDSLPKGFCLPMMI